MATIQALLTAVLKRPCWFLSNCTGLPQWVGEALGGQQPLAQGPSPHQASVHLPFCPLSPPTHQLHFHDGSEAGFPKSGSFWTILRMMVLLGFSPSEMKRLVKLAGILKNLTFRAFSVFTSREKDASKIGWISEEKTLNAPSLSISEPSLERRWTLAKEVNFRGENAKGSELHCFRGLRAFSI